MFYTDEGVSSAKKATFSFTGSGSGQPAAPTDPFKFATTSATTTTTTVPSSSLFTFSANKSTASMSAPSGGVFGAPPTMTSAPSFAAREYQQLVTRFLTCRLNLSTCCIVSNLCVYTTATAAATKMKEKNFRCNVNEP